MKTLVIIPGGFHPFHSGHYSLYTAAEKRYPGADIYIAATNDTSDRPFPFAIKERLAKLAGIPAGHFVQVKSPFQAKEITQQYDPASTVLIFVRSEKDRSESPQPGKVKRDGAPGYLQAYRPDGALDTMDQHGYMDYLPTIEFSGGITSASEIRAGWPNLDPKRKMALVLSMYPATQKNIKLAKTVVGLLDTAIGAPIEETSLADMRAELALMDRDRPNRSAPMFKSRGEFEQYAKKQRELAANAEIVKQMTDRKPPTAWPHGRDLGEDLDGQFDMIEEWVESIAEQHGVDAEQIWEDFDAVDDATLLETAAWKKKSGKNKNGGLNAKGVASYRREHPGSHLQTAVTTKPSKLKPGSKAAKRRKSFCARMSGVKGPMKKPNGKPTRKALALRKWNCHESVMEAANAAQQAAIAINMKKHHKKPKSEGVAENQQRWDDEGGDEVDVEYDDQRVEYQYKGWQFIENANDYYSGEAWLVEPNGTKTWYSWKKDDEHGITKYYDKQGNHRFNLSATDEGESTKQWLKAYASDWELTWRSQPNPPRLHEQGVAEGLNEFAPGGQLDEIKKGQKDSNGYTRCWPGKHAEGTKKGKNGGQVRRCVPNKSVAESSLKDKIDRLQRQLLEMKLAVSLAKKTPL